MAVSRRPEKDSDGLPTASSAARAGSEPVSGGGGALRRRHPGYGPHPARHLARRGAVGHARPLAGGGHGLPAVDQPAVALRRVAPRRGATSDLYRFFGHAGWRDRVAAMP